MESRGELMHVDTVETECGLAEREVARGPRVTAGEVAREEPLRGPRAEASLRGDAGANRLVARMAKLVGPHRSLVLVNAYAPRDWIPGVNRDLAAFAKKHPGVVVADWSKAIGAHPDYLAGDAIHPGARGGAVFADTVARTVEAVEEHRAQRAYERELRLYHRLTERPLPVAE